MNDKPEDKLEELERQLKRALAHEQEALRVAYGFKNLRDRRDYLQQAEYYKQRAADLARDIETLLSRRS